MVSALVIISMPAHMRSSVLATCARCRSSHVERCCSICYQSLALPQVLSSTRLRLGGLPDATASQFFWKRV